MKIKKQILKEKVEEAQDVMEQALEQSKISKKNFEEVTKRPSAIEVTLEREPKWMKKLPKGLVESYGTQLKENHYVFAVKSRKELAEILGQLKESKIDFKVNRSLKENYRYDVIINEAVEDDYYIYYVEASMPIYVTSRVCAQSENEARSLVEKWLAAVEYANETVGFESSNDKVQPYSVNTWDAKGLLEITDITEDHLADKDELIEFGYDIEDEEDEFDESLKEELKVINGFECETGHTLDEYKKLYGDKYDKGELWDFSIKDVENGAIEKREDVKYWLLKDESGEERVFEVEKELEESCCKEEVKGIKHNPKEEKHFEEDCDVKEEPVETTWVDDGKGGSKEVCSNCGKEVDESLKEELAKTDKQLQEDVKIITDIWEYEPWSGAIETWEKIEKADKIEDLDFLLEDIYPDGLTKTELNDLLWFEADWVLEQLGLDEEVDDTVEDEEEVEGIEEVDFDRRAVEQEYGLEDGELDGMTIREAEVYLGLENGELDRFMIEEKEEEETEVEESLTESRDQWIYLFPDSGAMGDYKEECKKFNLKYLGKNEFEDEHNLVIKGSLGDLNDYAEWLGYELHPDYLYKEEEFAGDIIEESVNNEDWFCTVFNKEGTEAMDFKSYEEAKAYGDRKYGSGNYVIESPFEESLKEDVHIDINKDEIKVIDDEKPEEEVVIETPEVEEIPDVEEDSDLGVDLEKEAEKTKKDKEKAQNKTQDKEDKFEKDLENDIIDFSLIDEE